MMRSGALALTYFLAPATAAACPITSDITVLERMTGDAAANLVALCHEADMDFAAPTPAGDVPFHYAVAVATNTYAVQTMLAYGTDPNTGKNGSPAFVDAINYAADRADPKLLAIISILGLAGADFSMPDAYGDLALSKAAGGGDAALVEILLQYGADPNGLNTYSRTPLFETVFGTCNTNVGWMLIEAGARIDPMPAEQQSRLFDEAEAHCVADQYYINTLYGLD